MTSPIRTLLLAVLLLTCAAAGAHADGYSRAAQQVIAQARAATGGSGWNMLRGWHEVGQDGAVRYESWVDPLRYGQRVELHEPAGLRVHGFNGMGAWQILPNGVVTGVVDLTTVRAARTQAFFGANAFLYPGRYDARADYLGVKQNRGRAFDVVAVQPWGGASRELWFDRRTHLLGRMVERGGAKPVTTEVSDYRKVGPVLVAFRYTVDDGTSAMVRERQVQSLDFAPADRAVFSLPRP